MLWVSHLARSNLAVVTVLLEEQHTTWNVSCGGWSTKSWKRQNCSSADASAGTSATLARGSARSHRHGA